MIQCVQNIFASMLKHACQLVTFMYTFMDKLKAWRFVKIFTIHIVF